MLAARADSSKTLQLIEFEEMRDRLNTHIAKSQTYLSDEGEDADSALEELKKALTLLLMKPSANEPQTPLLRLIQNEVIKYRSFLSVLRECIQTAISDFQAGADSPQQQANQIYILENTISYLQSINNEESNAILKDIRTAKLKISDELSGYLLMEMGRGKNRQPLPPGGTNSATAAGQAKKRKESPG